MVMSALTSTYLVEKNKIDWHGNKDETTPHVSVYCTILIEQLDALTTNQMIVRVEQSIMYVQQLRMLLYQSWKKWHQAPGSLAI